MVPRQLRNTVARKTFNRCTSNTLSPIYRMKWVNVHAGSGLGWTITKVRCTKRARQQPSKSQVHHVHRSAWDRVYTLPTHGKTDDRQRVHFDGLLDSSIVKVVAVPGSSNHLLLIIQLHWPSPLFKLARSFCFKWGVHQYFRPVTLISTNHLVRSSSF
jgi:hypothetical protein